MNEFASEFPALLEIDYADRELDRLKTFLRPFTVIPSPSFGSPIRPRHLRLAANAFILTTDRYPPFRLSG